MDIKVLYGLTIGNENNEHSVEETLGDRLKLAERLEFDGVELRFNKHGKIAPRVRDIKEVVRKAGSMFNHNNLHLSEYVLNLISEKKLGEDFLEYFVNIIGHYHTAEDIVSMLSEEYVSDLESNPKYRCRKRAIVKILDENIIPIDFSTRLLIENGSRPENNLTAVVSRAKKLGLKITFDTAHFIAGFYEFSEGTPHDTLKNYAWFKDGLLKKFKKRKLKALGQTITHCHISGVKKLELEDGAITWDCHYPLNHTTTKSLMKRETLKEILKYAPIESSTIELRKEFQTPEYLGGSCKYFREKILSLNVN